MPQSLEPVLQGDLVVDTPLALGGTFSFVTWYNGQLTNETGAAAFPDGNGGQLTEIDLVGNYRHELGGVELSIGGVTYTFPQVRQSTKECYLGASVEALGLAHTLTGYYEIDLLDDFYLSYQASRAVEVAPGWRASLAFRLGYMSDGQAAHYFGTDEAGLSDAALSGTVRWASDENTSVYLEAGGVAVLDDDLEQALDARSLKDEGVWVALGLAFGL